MSPIPSYTLHKQAKEAVEIPAIGQGCWSGTVKEQWDAGEPWMTTAGQQGYRHFDTAAGYGTEPVVARAIKGAGLKREEVFITTKLDWDEHYNVEAAFAKSLKNLDTDYVDLYLMHWPFAIAVEDENADPKVPIKSADGDLTHNPKISFLDTWAAMEKIHESGRAKAIGVSNFSVKHLETLLKNAKYIPAVNQVEMHPYLAQPELLAFCEKNGVKITAYSPSGYDKVRNDSTIVAIAKKNGVTPTQTILAWHLKRGVIAIPKGTSVKHQKENLDLVTLSEEDFEAINKLDRNERQCNKENERGLVWAWTYEQLGW
ncbi:hypothetical protein EIP91_007992 [Steccherinum ochraceum]|uniref:NADP-dependent oxidoreductase domain-containing protein n=1 Tax=Steccherinum ochraceum TaxID=92696 RepID=A0A4R0R666_9APHY|nr:hypothetical protein EIP91_007992 [Steccherinum ochraceum]